MNFIKVEKDYDDIKVTIQFSGRDEYSTFHNLLSYAYVFSDEIAETDEKLNTTKLKELFENYANLVSEIQKGE